MTDLKIGFIGAGKMAQCLASGFVAAGIVNSKDITMSAPTDKNLKIVKELKYRVTHSNIEVVESSKVIFLTIKPSHLKDVLNEVKQTPNYLKKLIVSVVTGATIDTIEKMLDSRFAIIRIVTNTGVQVKSGVTVFAKNSIVTDGDEGLIMNLMTGVGHCVEAPENLFNAVTGVAGSGPAYIYLVIQAMADGAVKMGIPRQLALNLATHTCLGAAKMVSETGKHPGELQDEIASPGGTTIHGLHQLETSGVRGAIMSAVEAATLRANHFTANKQMEK